MESDRIGCTSRAEQQKEAYDILLFTQLGRGFTVKPLNRFLPRQKYNNLVSGLPRPAIVLSVFTLVQL